jgi:hypothetical protein
MVAAVVGFGGGRSGAKLTERAASSAGEEMAGGLWLARRGKTVAAESVERDEGGDGMAGGRD